MARPVQVHDRGFTVLHEAEHPVVEYGHLSEDLCLENID